MVRDRGGMPSEQERKRIALEYCRRMSTGEPDRLVELFAPEATIEDPVGGEPVTGREALRTFYRDLIDRTGPQVEPGTPRASHDDESVVVPLVVRISDGRELASVDLFHLDESGAITHLWAYWGPSDSR